MGVKLLLADESITIRKVVQIIYRNSDTQVLIASDINDLVSSLKTSSPDVILLSATFPGINVQTDIRAICQTQDHTAIPVLLLADRGDNIDAQASIALGASAFLYKPLDNRELKKTVESVLQAASSQVAEMETSVQPSVGSELQESPAVPEVTLAPTPLLPKTPQQQSPEQRAKILMEILESYLNENVVLLTDALAKNLAPKIAPEIAGKILEQIDLSELPFKIARIIEGVISDLVPQLAEELISREIDKIKDEAGRIVNARSTDLRN